jgi:cell division protease FtsH
VSEILLRRETIEREQFLELLDGSPEEEVFAEDRVPEPDQPPPKRAPAGARLPRPGWVTPMRRGGAPHPR